MISINGSTQSRIVHSIQKGQLCVMNEQNLLFALTKRDKAKERERDTKIHWFRKEEKFERLEFGNHDKFS